MLTKDLILIRDCFLNLFAEALRFEEEPDADHNGQFFIDCTNYHLIVPRAALEELANSLDIHARRDETIGDAIRRTVTAAEFGVDPC